MERAPTPGPVQPDLLPALLAGKTCTPVRGRKKTARAKTVCTTLPPQQDDLFARPLPPLPRSRFMPDEIRLSFVPSPEKIQPCGEDAFLYMVVSQSHAQHLMATGLPLDRRAPLMLTERAGICPWLAKTADTAGGDSHNMPVVLKLKRSLVAQALEVEPDHTAEFATACYLLSGEQTH
ncbi:hypothetical protein [Acetobacter sp. LMG 32666]|uniref:hypothetical protein n=1 Tax=Acetobacter sp. LMG 32666 TaxID=2959295 RepID=UPI0030C801AF